MNKALKITDIEDGTVELNSTPTTKVNELSHLDAEEIRAKIKAARLEKLMARQLENELSFELDVDIGLTEPEPVAKTTPEYTAPSIRYSEPEIEIPQIEEAIELDMPASKSRGYSAGSTKRMRNIQTTRHSCDEMVSRIRTGADILSSLDEQTTNLVKQLRFMEQEFIRFEEAEAKATKLSAEHKRVTGEYEEALNLIERQSRQLDVLEAQRSNINANYEATKAELDKLHRQFQREAELLSESQMVNSELEQENRSLTSKLNSTTASLQETTSELNSTSNTLKQKDMEAARAQAELVSTKERLGNAESSLEATSRELETLSRQFTEKEIEFQNMQSSLTTSNEKLESAQQSLDRATRELEVMTDELHEKDMMSAKLTSDYSSLIKSNTKVMTDLDNIQNKYDELNKSALEQQSQQYARIHELESALRDTKRQLEVKTKANAELNVELEATNNLLVLHEEMVTALSPEDRR